jgi:hypothetical protein
MLCRVSARTAQFRRGSRAEPCARPPMQKPEGLRRKGAPLSAVPRLRSAHTGRGILPLIAAALTSDRGRPMAMKIRRSFYLRSFTSKRSLSANDRRHRCLRWAASRACHRSASGLQIAGLQPFSRDFSRKSCDFSVLSAGAAHNTIGLDQRRHTAGHPPRASFSLELTSREAEKGH